MARSYAVKNETNRQLIVEAADGSRFILEPLEVRYVFDENDLTRFALRQWPTEIRVEPRKAETKPFQTGTIKAALRAALVFIPVWLLLKIVFGDEMWWKLGWVAAATVLLGAVLLDAWRSRPDKMLRLVRRGLGWLRSWGAQQLYLLGSLLIGFGVPAVAIFFGTDIPALIDIVRNSDGTTEHNAVLTLIARVMQLVFIWTASLTPALLFFLFDRDHLNTLRNRFTRQIMRFDPTTTTNHAVLQKYGSVMNEAYGRDLSGKILPGRRSPLLLATVAITFGWMLTLLHSDLLLVSEDENIIQLFEPRNSAVCFAFLGAYFYGINAILRGYVRRDLRPKVYSTLIVRLVVVVLLAWVFDVYLDGTPLLLAAFLAGLVPETALVLIKEAGRGALGYVGRQFDELEEHDPLTKLEGIDLYDRARLFDEGVTNVESLAHHDLVELMLQTRIPIPRLVDWVDQAILYLHAGPYGGTNTVHTRTTALETLRGYGIRTATDLDRAFDAAQSRNELDLLVAILGSENGGPPRLRTIKDALDDDEWMIHLRNWRNPASVLLEPRHLRVVDLVTA